MGADCESGVKVTVWQGHYGRCILCVSDSLSLWSFRVFRGLLLERFEQGTSYTPCNSVTLRLCVTSMCCLFPINLEAHEERRLFSDRKIGAISSGFETEASTACTQTDLGGVKRVPIQ